MVEPANHFTIELRCEPPPFPQFIAQASHSNKPISLDRLSTIDEFAILANTDRVGLSRESLGGCTGMEASRFGSYCLPKWAARFSQGSCGTPVKIPGVVGFSFSFLSCNFVIFFVSFFFLSGLCPKSTKYSM